MSRALGFELHGVVRKTGKKGVIQSSREGNGAWNRFLHCDLLQIDRRVHRSLVDRQIFVAGYRTHRVPPLALALRACRAILARLARFANTPPHS